MEKPLKKSPLPLREGTKGRGAELLVLLNFKWFEGSQAGFAAFDKLYQKVP
jgi:hypothetical protein